MSIEPRDGKQAYVFAGAAVLVRPKTNHIRHFLAFSSADSEDEAYGIAMKVMFKAYPVNEGWKAHDVVLRRIDDINWVTRLDEADVKTVEI
jgi:hypothetical protein